MRTNHCHQNAGCIVENNQASNASIAVHSAGDVFDDNGLGCMIGGGLVSTGSANWSTTKFDAYQSVFANNTRTNFNPKVTGGDNLVLDGLFIAIWARATLGGNWVRG